MSEPIDPPIDKSEARPNDQPKARSGLASQLNMVLAVLEKNLAFLESKLKFLSEQKEQVLYRHTPDGNRRSGIERRSTSRGEHRDRRLGREERLALLNAEIASLVASMEFFKKKRSLLREMPDAQIVDSQTEDSENEDPQTPPNAVSHDLPSNTEPSNLPTTIP